MQILVNHMLMRHEGSQDIWNDRTSTYTKHETTEAWDKTARKGSAKRWFGDGLARSIPSSSSYVPSSLVPSHLLTILARPNRPVCSPQ